MRQEIIRRLRAAAETGTPEGLLFHATGEPWEGTPQLGGDGLFWTAGNPVIAQQYIPEAGMTALVSTPLGYKLDERVWPEKHSFWHEFVASAYGLRPKEVEYDIHDRLKSWSLPENWPTYRECVDRLRDEFGYVPDRNGNFEVKQVFEGTDLKFVHADYRRPGTLFVTLRDGLSFKDLRKSTEGDLMEPDHRRLTDFETAATEGFDGVIINDFAQTDCGNYGHVSYGLTLSGLGSRDWVEVPVVRFDIRKDRFGRMTPDLLEWIAKERDEAPAPAM